MKSLVRGIQKIIILCLLLVIETVSAQSGNPFIDYQLYNYELKVGGSAAPTDYQHPQNYPNGAHRCSSSEAPPAEENCPSDLLYAPNQNTGGYQSWGVGASLIDGGLYVYITCYFSYVEIFPDYWQPLITCNYLTFELEDHTWGIAIADIAFGDDPINTSWGNRPMGTLAFKANSVYQPVDQSVACNPSFFGASAPCDFLANDVYAINDNAIDTDAGYEDKIYISDHGCNELTQASRTGGELDGVSGCFTHHGASWLSDLPSPYRDTTLFDERNQFRPAVGSREAHLINENVAYFWYTNFWQLNFEAAPSEFEYVFEHRAAVTKKVDVIFIDCDQNPGLCYFGVDQTVLERKEM